MFKINRIYESYKKVKTTINRFIVYNVSGAKNLFNYEKENLSFVARCAALSMTACTDITETTVDYGGNTFINDYSSLVDAVNNLLKD